MPVKREYSSQLRAAQARQTRRVVVAAAARLFVAAGFGLTTIDAVADAAGVSRRTVFVAAGGKGELLKLALEWALVGDDDAVPLQDRPGVRAIGQLTDPQAIVAGFVAVVTESAPRVAELSQVLIAAAGADPEMRTLREEHLAQRWAGARAFVGHLARHGGLRDGIANDTAADIVWVHSDPGMYHRFVIERHWSHTQYVDWLRRTLAVQLLPAITGEPGVGPS